MLLSRSFVIGCKNLSSTGVIGGRGQKLRSGAIAPLLNHHAYSAASVGGVVSFLVAARALIRWSFAKRFFRCRSFTRPL